MRPSGLLLIFDLDGTLIDSREDLAISTNATRKHFGLPPLPLEVVQSYVGNGAAVLVRRAMGADTSEQVMSEAIAFFLQYYRAHSLQHTRLYAGIFEAIQTLHADHYDLAVLTNKPYKISLDILQALGLGSMFFQVYGGDSFPEKKPHPLGIATLQREKSAPPEETWMIGDSSVDVQTARNAGVRACGVSWGFQPDSFHNAPPDQVVNTPQEWIPLFREERS